MESCDICFADSATTHTILQNKKYFLKLTLAEDNVNTISDTSNIIEGSRRACIILPNDTKLDIKNALYSSKSKRNLLSFKDICYNRYRIETISEGGNEYLCINSFVSGHKRTKEKLLTLPSGMYYTFIKAIETNHVMNPKFNDTKSFILWHDRLGHPGATMMH